MRQKEIFITVSDEIFSRFPDYLRGVVIAESVNNGESPAGLLSLLRAEEESIRKDLDPEAVVQHPKIAAWREAYRSFGAKPSKFRPSIEAMVRRVLRGELLPSISKLVDIGAVVSLRHMVPAGGHAIDVLSRNMDLRLAVGDETFVPLDSDQPENPLPGEIIFAEGSTVLTRRWTWRQGKHTLVAPETTAVEINVDGLPPVTASEVEAACHELVEYVRRFCGGEVRYEILSKNRPKVQL
jgi:DNA/RNA-binding domain of Phe-tRNA-synthetase-like protein